MTTTSKREKKGLTGWQNIVNTHGTRLQRKTLLTMDLGAITSTNKQRKLERNGHHMGLEQRPLRLHVLPHSMLSQRTAGKLATGAYKRK